MANETNHKQYISDGEKQLAILFEEHPELSNQLYAVECALRSQGHFRYTAEDRIEELEEDLEAVRKKNDHVVHEKDEAIQSLEQKNEDLKDLAQAREKDLKDARKHSEDQRRSLEVQVKHAEKAYNDARKEANSQQQKVEMAKKEAQQSRLDYKNLDESFNRAQAEVIKLESAKSILQNEVDKVRAEKSQMGEALSHLNQVLEMKELDDSQNYMEGFTAEDISQATDSVGSLKAELEAVGKKLQDKEDEAKQWKRFAIESEQSRRGQLKQLGVNPGNPFRNNPANRALYRNFMQEETTERDELNPPQSLEETETKTARKKRSRKKKNAARGDDSSSVAETPQQTPATPRDLKYELGSEHNSDALSQASDEAEEDLTEKLTLETIPSPEPASVGGDGTSKAENWEDQTTLYDQPLETPKANKVSMQEYLTNEQGTQTQDERRHPIVSRSIGTSVGRDLKSSEINMPAHSPQKQPIISPRVCLALKCLLILCLATTFGLTLFYMIGGGKLALRERQMWLRANEPARRALLFLMKGKDEPKMASWLTEDSLGKVDQIYLSDAGKWRRWGPGSGQPLPYEYNETEMWALS